MTKAISIISKTLDLTSALLVIFVLFNLIFTFFRTDLLNSKLSYVNVLKTSLISFPDYFPNTREKTILLIGIIGLTVAYQSLKISLFFFQLLKNLHFPEKKFKNTNMD